MVGSKPMPDIDIADPPQFSSSYWDKVPRQQIPATVFNVRTINADDGSVWKEFQCKLVNGQMTQFRRKSSEVRQLIMGGLRVNLETIHGELISGMYLPEVQAWAFRMTSADLANYTREISGVLEDQRNKARELMVKTLTKAMFTGLMELGLIAEAQNTDMDEFNEDYDSARHLALVAITALETGPQ